MQAGRSDALPFTSGPLEQRSKLLIRALKRLINKKKPKGVHLIYKKTYWSFGVWNLMLKLTGVLVFWCLEFGVDLQVVVPPLFKFLKKDTSNMKANPISNPSHHQLRPLKRPLKFKCLELICM